MAPQDPPRARELAGVLGLQPVVGQLLINRGLADVASAADFLRPGQGERRAPWRLPGVKAAAWRMLRAVRRGETVVVYGDYDADGQTSAAILARALGALGAQVRTFIPHRLSLGYGLHEDVLVEMASRGVGLVVAVDCGLTAGKAVAEAKRRGLDVVVVDHHEAPARLPPAAAIVASHRMKGMPGGDQLSAAGLSYHTAMALLELAGCGEASLRSALVQLAAVGTVADVVSLTGENRRLVQEGLAQIRIRPIPGLLALAREAGLDLAAADAHHIAFVLAPRLNAAGRVADASAGLDLLLAQDEPAAAPVARRLEEANRSRQATEREVLDEAIAQAQTQLEGGEVGAVVVAGEGWHPGVIGVVASRLVDRFARPAVVIGVEGDEARGSARSVPGVNVHEALAAAGDLFTRFGGHPMAAGFSLRAADVAELRRRLVEAIAERWRGPYARRLPIDAWIGLDDVTEPLVRQLEWLQPYGEGNPRPVLASPGLRLVEVRPIGRAGQHLRMVVQDPASGAAAKAIAFGRADEWGEIVARASAGGLVDLAFSPQVGRFGEIEVKAIDLRVAEKVAPHVAWWEIEGTPRRLAEPAAGETSPPVMAFSAGSSPAVRVEDRRGISDSRDRAALVAWVHQEVERLSRGPSGVVAAISVRSARDAAALCAELGAQAEDLRLRVSWLEPPAGAVVPPGLFQGSRVLITWEREALARVEPGGTLLVWQLPLEPDAWARACVRAGIGTLVLAYGQDDLRVLEGEWLHSYPSVEDLRRIFRLLSAQASLAGGRLPADVYELDAALGVLDGGWAQGRPGRLLLERSLGVFEELGLVAPEAGGRGWRWKGARAGTKLDLARSPRYNECARIRESIRTLVDEARGPDPVAWWQRWIARPDVPA